ncbi:MAG: phospho-N-acetylmuramoyl-pentapeptide-transferase [Bacteroidetes bacterium]|uniref:Phospho-N-acetylmuramoyl-pentapeptide-transferase n=1 Tax=Candidatus Cryptobacteroides faecipullorum TaxID=2840764 RepID=A0A9D9I6I5_9BACT|nr:phospho-N-acetylmuramoyl-pentapeptide-transferase [Candidatus Cryptobacteroides faecipullorum]
MLYHLFEYLKEFNIPGAGLMQYLTFRAIFASVTSLLFAVFIGKRIIRWLQKKQIGEEIRDLGLEGQMQKKGTPTMGGIIIILAILIAALLFCDLTNIYTILLILSTIWFGFLGFADDFIKVFRHNKEGMSEKGKLIGQIIMGLVIGITVCFNEHIVVREELRSGEESSGVVVSTGTAIAGSSDGTARLEYPGTEGKKGQDVVKSTKTTIPFVKNHEFDYKWLSPFKGKWGWYCKWGIYVLMIVLVITACSNGTNLTDGMDGLATGTSAIVGVVLGIFAWLSGNIINADYLNIMYIPGTGEIAVFMAAFVGALIGFLWYNAFPAQVFMGDTGSLAIGGIIGVCAILIRKELLLPILCGVFFVESLSVIIQRFWFKYTKRRYGTGRRVFKMTPLHHHFQKEGIPAVISSPAKALPEAKIVVRFWIIGIILAVLTIALLKIR